MTVNPRPPNTMRAMITAFVGMSPEKRTRLSLKVEKPALQKAETEWNRAW